MLAKQKWPSLAGTCLLACLTLSPSIGGQSNIPAPSKPPAVLAPVAVGDKTVFSVEGVLSFPAEARAAAISRRIEALSKDLSFNPAALAVADSESAADIMAGDLVVMSVTDKDATDAGKTRQELAKDYAEKISATVVSLRKEYSVKSIVVGVLLSVLSTAVLLLLLRVLSIVFPRIYRKINLWRGTRIPSLRIQKFELLPADRIADIAIGLGKILRLAIVVVVVYFYLSLVLGFFP